MTPEKWLVGLVVLPLVMVTVEAAEPVLVRVPPAPLRSVRKSTLVTLTPLVSMLAPLAIFQGRALLIVKLAPNLSPPPPTVRPCDVTLWLALRVTVPGPLKKNPPELEAVTVPLTWIFPGPPKVTLCCPGPLALLIAEAMVTPAELVERMTVSDPVPETVPPVKVIGEVPLKSNPLVGFIVPEPVTVTEPPMVLSSWS